MRSSPVSLLPLLAACAAAPPAGVEKPSGPAPAYAIAGEYFETTSCEVGCRDMFGLDPPREEVDALAAFRIVRGRVDGTDLSGWTLAIAASSDREGRWTGAVFVDEGAPAPAREGLARLVADRFGARFERLLRPRSVPMEWRRYGSRHLLRIGAEASIGHFEIDAVPGREGRPITIANAPGALSPLVHLAQSISSHLNDPVLRRSWHYQGKNAAYGSFEWRRP